jgi:raffinose/stachyose/melibiose transport system permease protein
MNSTVFKKNKEWLFLFAAPAVIVFCIIIVIPLFQTLYYSLFVYNGIHIGKYVGLDNYLKMFHSRELSTSLINSIVYAAILLAYQVGIATVFAFILAQSKIKGKQFFRNVYFIPVLLSVSVVAQLWVQIYNGDFGLINHLFTALGLEWQQNWLNQKWFSLFAVAFVEAWKGMGYILVIIYAGIRNIPDVYNEAAVIDGTTPAQKFRNITLPLTAPTIRICAVMCITNGFRAFDTTYLMTGGGPGIYTYNLTIMMYNAMMKKVAYGYGSAIATLIVVICVGLMWMINKSTSKYDTIYD